ncbi:hypothetical protein J7438_02495 [Thalassotalea sp. G20_0]|uniref:ZmpA/ZmpB/ZmpC family metallo-endopeptidase-related protein n=1 Tax=Thalassotalea sp. G20_0 TaxID=2821093 RepID=UPI001ADC1E0F|nr:ZmpA/ZmpB/ZmpC family metallo-endopeptidase-related protein [Thalassotalea sp. G20_0]MBO9492962.1 hypothetical protein [Thalassotalea sp. G20_0]
MIQPIPGPPVPDVAGSAAGFDFPGRDGQTSDCLQFITLAGRAIAAYSGLPSEINSLLSYLANLAVAGRFASDQLNAFNACDGSIPELGTHRENTPDETLENTKNKTRKASQNLRQQTGKSAAPTLRSSQLPNTPLALGALVGLSAVGAASASAPDTDSWVEVRDAEDLGKICQDKESCSKQYRLTEDIDGSQLSQSIGNKVHPFTGKLDGNCRTIDNLLRCLVEHLSAEGSIENLILIDANINSTAPAGVAACEMSGDARISNIHVERACIATRGENATAAIAVGKINNGTVTNTKAANCRVETFGNETDAGIGAGYQAKESVIDTTAVNCTVTTSGEKANAGIGVGVRDKANVTDTTAVNCKVITSGKEANAGIGAGSIKGKQGSTDYTKVINSFVDSTGNATSADINGGNNTVICNVIVNGEPKSTAQGCHYWQNNTLFCEDLDRRFVTSDCQAVNTGIDTSNGTNALPSCPITETVATVPGTAMNVSSPGSVTLTTPPTTAATTPGMTFSSPDSATLAKSTPLVQSLNTVFLACITLGALFVVLVGATGVYTYRYCNQRSSARAGRNRPMPWQPDDRSITYRPLPAPPQNHCDLLLVRPENTATGCSSAMANTGKEPDQQRPDRPNVLNEDEAIDSLYEPMGVKQAGMAKGGSNPMVNTGKQPDQQRSDRSDVLNEYESIDDLYELMEARQAIMAKGGSYAMLNTGKQPDPGQQRPAPRRTRMHRPGINPPPGGCPRIALENNLALANNALPPRRTRMYRPGINPPLAKANRWWSS